LLLRVVSHAVNVSSAAIASHFTTPLAVSGLVAVVVAQLLRRQLRPNRLRLVFWRVLNQVCRVIIYPVGCDYFDINYYAVGDVGANDCYGAFAHTWYSIQT
jgi:hypothetical protein